MSTLAHDMERLYDLTQSASEPTEAEQQEAFLAALEEETAADLRDRAGRDVYLDHLLERLRERQEGIEANNAIADRRIAMIEGWRNQVNGSLERECRWLELGIRAAAEDYDFAGKKSRSLPNGTFGYRLNPEKVEITDPAAALRYAEKHGLPLKREVQRTVVKAHIEATGIIPDGCALVPGENRFFVKAG